MKREYRLVETTIEVRQRLTLKEFRAVEQIFGHNLGRHKDWSDLFVFQMSDAPSGAVETLLTYLRKHKIHHNVEILRAWCHPVPRLKNARTT